jgi:hypothetical protein
MANRLQTLIPAMFQPTDPAITGEPLAVDGRIQRLTVFAAVTSALMLVVLIAVLMGMT